VIVPKDFLEAGHVGDGPAEWVLTDQGILLRPVQDASAIENEPAFAAFLNFLDTAAARHPDRLADTTALTDRYLHLIEGVEVDADLPE
jgi:hypothetical protein